MSTQPVTSGTPSTPSTSSNQYASGSSLSSLGGGSLQITGLASGLNTNAVVQALMAAQQQQVTNLQNQQSGITALNKQLTSIQTALQTVANDATALGSPTLFKSTQTISSTNSTLVGATATGSNGAVVGSYQISVTALASASQRTFLFGSPANADTVTIDGHDTNLAAGASAQDLVNAINNDKNATVWATVTGTDPSTGKSQVVLSERNTGAPPASNPNGFVAITNDSEGALTEQTQYATAGTNAAYTINGESTVQYSTSNTISGVAIASPNSGTPGATQTIPGVSLSLNALTGPTPITVTVGAPAPSTQSIQTAVQTFITDYNSAITQIQTQLSQTPSKSDPTQGTLYNDSDLRNLLSTMRQQMTQTLSGLSGSYNNMLQIGVSTGASSGNGTISSNSLAGDLTLDTNALSTALTTDSTSVHQLMQSWSIKFSSLVNREAGGGGSITTRIQTDTSHISFLTTQISNLQEANQVKQNQLVQEFAAMEAALSQNQSTSNWLTSQLNALPGFG
ncbi:MAG TPA: flagellar filament capping protein FliD [Solirubrobacteraceae bacterium]|nr:flagellar filament capping protein FliD [Solirubrobacteraceae bacterium]